MAREQIFLNSFLFCFLKANYVTTCINDLIFDRIPFPRGIDASHIPCQNIPAFVMSLILLEEKRVANSKDACITYIRDLACFNCQTCPSRTKVHLHIIISKPLHLPVPKVNILTQK
jgi:hypothetical protein